VANEVFQLQLEEHRCILNPKRQVQELVPEAVRRWEHLPGGDLVVDIGQHVEHLVPI
jgi:hypothetical protein